MDKSKKICVCYKKHKENTCEKPAPVPEPEIIPVPPVEPKPDYLQDESVALLNDEQLSRIAQSARLQELLKNEGLRRLVRMIDSSENPEYLLDKARKEDQRFMEFSDEILAIVGRAPGQTGTEQVLEAMGMGKHA
ncbi:hypothetical protein BGZ92_010483 [Podila epicladia]|nr:hypothetical protein BGZ92_010483 [Podila epicladia]